MDLYRVLLTTDERDLLGRLVRQRLDNARANAHDAAQSGNVENLSYWTDRAAEAAAALIALNDATVASHLRDA